MSTLARGTRVRGPGRGATASRRLLALLWLLLLPPSAGAWYKHVASPRYHTVGRAAGLLMGLRRSPYMWRRAAGPLTWDTLGLGALPQGPSARSTLSPGPAALDALLLPSGAQRPWEARRRSSGAGLRVSAPRNLPAPESARQPEWRPGAYSWILAEQARYAGRGRGQDASRRGGVSGDLSRAVCLPVGHPTTFLSPTPGKALLEQCLRIQPGESGER